MDGHVQKWVLLVCLTFGFLTDCAIIKDREKSVVWPTTPMVPPYREPPKLVNAPGAKEMVVPLGRSSVNDVPLFHAPGTRVSSVRPTMRLVPKLQPVETEEEALIRRQEWAAQTMDQSGISTIVHDPQTGERGVTALKDVDRNACFINYYFEPFVLPSSQREFYAKNLPATIIESDDEQEQFQKCVGPAVAKHCQDAKTYWLDKNLFLRFVDDRESPQKLSHSSDNAPTRVKKIRDALNRKRRNTQNDCSCDTGSRAIVSKAGSLGDLLEAKTINPLRMEWLTKKWPQQIYKPEGPIPIGPIGPDSPFAKALSQAKLQSQQLLQGK